MVVLTEGDVSDVVPDGGVRVLQLQGGLPVAEQHLGGCVAGSPTLFKLLNARKAQFQSFGSFRTHYRMHTESSKSCQSDTPTYWDPLSM